MDGDDAAREIAMGYALEAGCAHQRGEILLQMRASEDAANKLRQQAADDMKEQIAGVERLEVRIPSARQLQSRGIAYDRFLEGETHLGRQRLKDLPRRRISRAPNRRISRSS